MFARGTIAARGTIDELMRCDDPEVFGFFHRDRDQAATGRDDRAAHEVTMTTKAQRLRVGVFVVMSAALLAAVLIVFGGLRIWDRHQPYRILFSRSVYGLEQGAHVYLNGVRVGNVEKIAAAKEDLRRVEVMITVEDGTPIHTDTRALLQLAGITGLKVIDLREGTLGAPRLPPGSTITEGETTLDSSSARPGRSRTSRPS